MSDRQELSDLVSDLVGQGMTQKEIASEIGYSRQYVYDLLYDPDGSRARKRKDAYRMPCPRCGKPMDGSGGYATSPSMCLSCFHSTRTRKWTRELILEVYKRHSALLGRPAASRDWIKLGFHEDKQGSFSTPSMSTVYGPGKLWPSWAEMVMEAGYPRPRPGVYDRSTRGKSRRRSPRGSRVPAR